MQSNRNNKLLELSPNWIRFEAVSKNCNVFYDESNRQIFVVMNRCSEGVVVRGPDDSIIKFKLEERGDVLSIKFSPASDVLALQRSPNTVEFINFTNGQPNSHYFQTSKSKNCKVLGFVWTNTYEMVFITDAGIEFYQIICDKKIIKCLKTISISVDWFVYQPETCLLLLANGTFANVIHSFQFRPNTVYKLSKFEIDWTHKQKAAKICLYERDVAIAKLYGKSRLLVLRHQPILKDQIGAHIMIYTFEKDAVPLKTDVLLLQLTGRFAINIVDDLVIVHHQTSQTSLVFDINLKTNELMGNVKIHYPVLPHCTIKPFKWEDNTDCELYSTNWVIFQPNIIIDARLGCLWFLQINLSQTIDLIQNIPLLIDFLMFRQNSKSILLKVCKNTIIQSEESNRNPLGDLSLIFNKLNAAYKEGLSLEVNSTQNNSDLKKQKLRTIVDQTDIFSNVFAIFEEQKTDLDQNLIVSILFEYIYSLSLNQIPIQYFVYEFLITHLVRTQQFYQMHQFLQYHVFSDSKQLACLLLSLEPHYKYAVQLALDMFKRLTTANEEIIEVLLSEYQLSRALRFIQNHANIDSISARKFLDVAFNSRDIQLFYSVYKFFELRNLRIRGSPAFANGEHCETYIEHFEKLFGSTSSLNNNEQNVK